MSPIGQEGEEGICVVTDETLLSAVGSASLLVCSVIQCHSLLITGCVWHLNETHYGYILASDWSFHRNHDIIKHASVSDSLVSGLGLVYGKEYVCPCTQCQYH